MISEDDVRPGVFPQISPGGASCYMWIIYAELKNFPDKMTWSLAAVKINDIAIIAISLYTDNQQQFMWN